MLIPIDQIKEYNRNINIRMRPVPVRILESHARRPNENFCLLTAKVAVKYNYANISH